MSNNSWIATTKGRFVQIKSQLQTKIAKNKLNQTSLFRAFSNRIEFVGSRLRPGFDLIKRTVVPNGSVFSATNLRRRELAPYIGLSLTAIFVLIANQANQHVLAANVYQDTYLQNIDPQTAQAVLAGINGLTPEFDEHPDQVANLVAVDSDFYLPRPDATAMAKAADSSRQPFQYTVQKGDTITAIANKYDLHVASILAVNQLQPAQLDQIKPGDNLTIPVVDLSSSSDWLVALADAKKQEQQAAIAAQQAAAAKKAKSQTSKLVASVRSLVSSSSSSGSSDVHVASGHSGKYIYGYCTDGVATWRPDLPSDLGNANTWVSRARAEGLSTGTTPQVGAVMQTRESYYGHVALVIAVGNGTITVRERNYRGWNVDSVRTLSSGDHTIVGYIY